MSYLDIALESLAKDKKRRQWLRLEIVKAELDPEKWALKLAQYAWWNTEYD